MENSTLVKAALLAPLPAIAFEPITASAYFRTKDGASSANPSWISVWTRPVQQHLHGLFTWASADTVYLTYGKVFTLAFAGMLCGLVALRRTDAADAGRFRWAWKVGVAAYALALLGIIGEYWSPWSNLAFVGLSLPSILLLFVISPFLGARMLKQGIGSRPGAWMVALTMPGIIAMTALGGHLGFAVIWLSVAWMLHARTMLYRTPVASAAMTPATA